MPDALGPYGLPRRSGPFAALLGWVLGVALQLQQGDLWGVQVYGLLACGGLLLAAVLRRRWLAAPAQPRGRLRRTLLHCRGRMERLCDRQRPVAWLLLAGALGFASTGLRSLVFDAGALNPALEGRDLRVVGVVIDMPQHNEAGLRFTLATESATLQGRPVLLPPLMDVGWYRTGFSLGGDTAGPQRPPGDVRAGERWSLSLRLKAPHGSRNPHGFDYELWLWERGVQATGYVRTGALDAAPQRLGQTGLHPLALLRQSVRERIDALVEQRPFAGLIAALVVGDQAAIDRGE